MTKEQFQELADAYGGDFRRWPVALRDEAARFAEAQPEFVRQVLAREALLDAALDELPRAPATAQLFEQIVGGAPALRRRRRLWLAPAGLAAALAGVMAAGLVLGVQLGARSTPGSETSGQSMAALDVSAVSAVSEAS